MKEKLTDKQKKFLDLVLSGMAQNEAYMSVYSVKNMATAAANASKCLTKSNCRQYLEEQRTKLAEKHIITREYKLQKLKEIMDKPDRQTDLISAIKVANEMDGHNAPQKLDVKQEIDINNLSTEELIKRAKAKKEIERDN